MFDKGAKTKQWSKDSFLTNGDASTNWISTWKKMILDTDLPPFIKIRITDLNVNWKTIGHIEEYIEEKLHNLWYGDDFLYTMSKAGP